jgi:hypothetical protein
VQITISKPDDEELQEVLKVSRREAEFQRRVGQHYEYDGVSGGGREGVEHMDCLEEPRPR